MFLPRLFFLIVLLTAPLLYATDSMNSIAERAVREVLFGENVVSPKEELQQITAWKNREEKEAALKYLNTHFNRVQLQKVLYILAHDMAETHLEMNAENARAYLSAAKWIDLTYGEDKFAKSTFKIRQMAARILGDKSITLDCFSLSANPHLLDNSWSKIATPNPSWSLVAQNDLIMVKERREMQKQLFIDYFTAILKLSNRLAEKQPTILIIRGNSGSGKTYWTMQHPFLSNALSESGPLSGVQNTDYFNQLLKERGKLSPNQNFYECIAMRKSLRDAIFKIAPQLSHVVDGWFNKYPDLELSVTMASKNGAVVKIIDLDVPLELSCMRLLSREAQPGCPSFKEVAQAFCQIRQVRHKLHEELLQREALAAYQLMVTDRNGHTTLVVEKKEGKIVRTPGTEALLAEATRTDNEVEEIQAVAHLVITPKDVDLFGVNLQPYVGMTIDQAMTVYRTRGSGK